jgi:Holliday junction DNA helicase RuvA
MIARLRGRLLFTEADAVIVDVGGVGYRVHVPAQLLASLGPEGTEVALHTYLHVRENEMVLFGARDQESMTLFAELLTVSGVGPRVAMASLSSMDPAALQQAIVSEDLDALTAVPGVGRKTAQRIVLDLKGKLEARVPQAPAGSVAAGPVLAEDSEAIAALEALGYTRGEARRALAAVDLPRDATLEERIMAALRTTAG